MIRRWIPLGLDVVTQLTTVGTCRYTLRINPAHQHARKNVRKKWRESASCDVQELQKGTIDTAKIRQGLGYGGMTIYRRSVTTV